jgi:anti-sigma factor RsiW
MQHDDLEFLISQYADGTLEEADRGTVERALESDPGARALLEEHRALTRLVRAAPLPEVRWEMLVETISGAIDDEMEFRMRRASWLIRPVRAGWLAVAASVLIAGGLAIHFMTGSRNTITSPTHGTSAPRTLLVEVSQPDRPEGKVVSEISIGAGGAYAKDSTLAPYADDIDTRPAHVVIASGASTPTQSGLPF